MEVSSGDNSHDDARVENEIRGKLTIRKLGWRSDATVAKSGMLTGSAVIETWDSAWYAYTINANGDLLHEIY